MVVQRQQLSEEFWPNLTDKTYPCSNVVSQDWRGVFQKFKNLESTDGNAPAMKKESRFQVK